MLAGTAYTVEKRKHGRGHIYEIDGVKMPRVTEICKTIVAKGGGFERWLQLDAIQRFQRILEEQPDADWTTQKASDILKWSAGAARSPLDRGTAVHRAAETQDFDIGNYHPGDQGYVRALAKFFEEEKPEITDQELKVGSKKLGYAGTLDARGFIGEDSVIWDYKTSKAAYAEYHFQVAAYEYASIEMGYGPTHRQLIVLLREDGSYEKVGSRVAPVDWPKAMAWYDLLSTTQRITR